MKTAVDLWAESGKKDRETVVLETLGKKRGTMMPALPHRVNPVIVRRSEEGCDSDRPDPVRTLQRTGLPHPVHTDLHLLHVAQAC